MTRLTKASDLTIVRSLLSNIAEGLVAYGTFESRVGMGAALCESTFYMPMMKIAKHLGWETSVEVPLKNLRAGKTGDLPRVDFYAHRDEYGVGVEVKFVAKFSKSELYPSYESSKLIELEKCRKKDHQKGFRGYRLIIGRSKKIDDVDSFVITRKQIGRLKEETKVMKSVRFDQSGLGYFCLIVRLV